MKLKITSIFCLFPSAADFTRAELSTASSQRKGRGRGCYGTNLSDKWSLSVYRSREWESTVKQTGRSFLTVHNALSVTSPGPWDLRPIPNRKYGH